LPSFGRTELWPVTTQVSEELKEAVSVIAGEFRVQAGQTRELINARSEAVVHDQIDIN
jgi:hypothetical protein